MERTVFSQKVDDLIDGLASERRRLERELDREVPLPPVLYHVALRNSSKRMIDEGIRPSRVLGSEDKVVCLSDDLDFAVGVVCTEHKIPIEEAKRRLVVFEVETGYKGGGMDVNNFRNYLRKSDPEARGIDALAIHEVHYVGVIPPEAIAVDNTWNK
jgi:hypothetical protein